MQKKDNFTTIRELIQSDNVKDARIMAKERETKPIRDAALHLRWADLLEELGLYDDLIVELNLAIRDNKREPGPYLRLAEVLADQGHADRAARCLQALADLFPENPDYYMALGRVLAEAGEYDRALKVYQAGAQKAPTYDFQPLIRSLNFLNSETDAAAPPPANHRQIIPQTRHLAAISELFAGREGVYARQWASPTGSTGYTPVHEPMTFKVMENHIVGNLTAGVYPVRLDNTVNFIALDFDMPKFAVNKAIARQSLWKKALGKVHEAACQLADIVSSRDVPCYLEHSGFKGYHLWIFLQEPLPAGVAKKFGALLVGQAKPMPSDVSIEIFPRQAHVKRGHLGNLIKIPLGFHKKTGQRTLFLGADGQPVNDQLGFLENITRTDRRAVYDIIRQWQPQPPVLSKAPRPVKAETESPFVHTETAPAREYDPERDPQFQYLLLKCPVLKRIVENINLHSAIDEQATLVLIHTVGHLDHGPDAVNTLFRRCINVDASRFMKSQLKGNPVSCPKIRSRIPQITAEVACNCRFDPNINMYPNPLIHVHTMPAAAKNVAVGITVDSMQFQNMLQEYLRLYKQMREMRTLMKTYEQRLHLFFEQAGVDTVNTPLGFLKRIEKRDGEVSFMLEMR